MAHRNKMRGAGGLLRRFAADSDGAVAPIVALSLVALLAVGGLAWDISRGYALRAELEAAADAAALAGATQLDGTAGAIDRATSAAQGSLVQNGQRLANTAEANATANAEITFLTDLDYDEDGNRSVTTSDADANFIQVRVSPRTLGLVFGAFTAVGNMQVRAHAVAGFGSAICKAPPLMVCNPDESESINIFNTFAGHGIELNGVGGQDSFGPGRFGYLQIDGGNLSALNNAMGRSPPQIECFGDEVVVRTGDPTTPLDWMNTRFDIYVNGNVAGVKNNQYYAPAPNTITGLGSTDGAGATLCIPKVEGTAYNGDSSAAGIVAMPLPRDTCAYPNGGSTCTGGANALGNGEWDRAGYFSITHGWTGALTTAPFTGEAWSTFYDYPGVSTKPTYPTRYQVYLWESANLTNNALWGNSQNPTPNSNPSGDGDWATKQCSNANVPSGVIDRRSITALVLNCSEIVNNQPAEVIGGVDLFLTEPGATGGNGTIHAEVIQTTTDISAVGKETRVYSVRLYE